MAESSFIKEGGSNDASSTILKGVKTKNIKPSSRSGKLTDAELTGRDGETDPPKTPHECGGHGEEKEENSLKNVNDLLLADENILGMTPYIGIEPQDTMPGNILGTASHLMLTG